MESIGECPLCERPMVNSYDDHHLVPKSRKGKETVRIHRICHRKIHSTFTEKELERNYNTIEKLLTNEAIQNFVKWVSKKDPDFYVGSDESRRKK